MEKDQSKKQALEEVNREFGSPNNSKCLECGVKIYSSIQFCAGCDPVDDTDLEEHFRPSEGLAESVGSISQEGEEE